MNDKQTRRYYDRGDKRPDLRAGLEAQKDTILNRSEMLEADQRALLTLILDQDGTFAQAARLRGEHATTVSRRFRRLLSRLSGKHIRKPSPQIRQLSAIDKTILSAFYMAGMTQQQIADRLDISRHRVRKTLARVETQQRGGTSRPIASDTVKYANPNTARSPDVIGIPAQRGGQPCTH